MHYFGEVVDGVMQFSPMGAIADVLWHEIKNHAKNVKLGRLVVMPNHIHGILILNNNSNPNETNDPNVGTRHALSPHSDSDTPKTIGQQRFQNQGKKYHFVHHWVVQIGRNPSYTTIGI